MIKFGIPSVEEIQDTFPGKAVLTLNSLEKSTSKRKFTLSKTAAESLNAEPGLSKVALSFDGGNFIAVIPETQEGVAANDKYPVNKTLSFISKVAYDYIIKKFELSSSVDNHLEFSSFEDNSGIIVGTFNSTVMVHEADIVVAEAPVDSMGEEGNPGPLM